MMAFQSQVGTMVPSTSSALPGDLRGVQHAASEHLPDQRPQQGPSAGHRLLGAAEDRAGHLLGEILAH
jgi:hypothetical protein